MASLSSMPLELLLHISRLTDFAGLKSLGSVNSQLRSTFAPAIFRTIRFTNLETDEDDVSQMISRHGQHASKVQFDFHLQLDIEKEDIYEPLPEGGFYGPDDESQDEMDDGTTLSNVALKILSGELLSHVSSMIVKFIPENDYFGEGWGDSDDLGCMYIFADVVHGDDLQHVEKRWPSWRRTMASMWSVLCRNNAITSLETEGLPALPLSSWLQPEWPAFLGRLKSLVLGIGGADNGAGWKATTAMGYRDFLQSLNEHFFRHAKSLNKLHLKAAPECFYGENDWYSSPTAFRRGQMPELEELIVENCFIDENCCTFLAHATKSGSSLKKLSLLDCMANDQTPSWSQTFTRLSRVGSELTLRELIVANEEIDFPADFASKISHLPEVKDCRPSDTICVRSTPKEEGEHPRPFAYGYVDDKYGMIFHLEDRNVEEYESGEDYRAYEELMKVIADNVTAASEVQVAI
ncbi:hypothetical protein CC79DRAFT_1330200 [Sarocladium strictum]